MIFPDGVADRPGDRRGGLFLTNASRPALQRSMRAGRSAVVEFR
jgi:hypothetical protein